MNFSSNSESRPDANRPSGALAESIETVPRDSWSDLIAWIDPLKDHAQVQHALGEFTRRYQQHAHGPDPLQAKIGTERVAAAYMVLLGARVAALGGVRGIDNHTNSAARVLTQLVQQVRAAGVVQIQAILDAAESVATEIVTLCGFVPLAELLQVSLLLPTRNKPAFQLVALPEGYQWRAATEVSRAQMTQLLAHTFIETLDCPKLNGLRTPDDVLDGFLDGQTIESRSHWWLMETGGKLMGCALVNPLPDAAAELVYMGLGPTSRGRGLGKYLLEQSVRAAVDLDADVFLAAVDAANWPASRLYFQAGFQETARVQAWFHRQ